eukprot:jgi/Chlat1/4448/Chrsp29S00328
MATSSIRVWEWCFISAEPRFCCNHTNNELLTVLVANREYHKNECHTLRHVFGARGDLRDGVAYADEGTLVYAAGRSAIICQVEARSQRVIQGTPESESISAVSLSPSRKGGAPDWTLVVWMWEKAKVAASLKTTNHHAAPVHQVAFHPQDPAVLSVVGDGICKTFRLADSLLKLLPSSITKRDQQNYVCHAWLPADVDRCVVATDNGELLLLENGEYKTTIPYTWEGRSIECIIGYSKGFIVGGERGRVTVFERADPGDGGSPAYRPGRTARVLPPSGATASTMPVSEMSGSSISGPSGLGPGGSGLTAAEVALRVRSLALSPSEETLVAATRGGNLLTLALSASDMMLKADEEARFEPLQHGFHMQGVTGLDLCIRKPLAVTCSTDKSVRVWNYLERTCEMVKFFPEEAHSVAFHPSGLHILVGFADKLRLMNLLMDDIRGDDARLVTAGADGAVYEWRLRDCKREREHVLKGCAYAAALPAPPDGRTLVAVGSDRTLKELDEAAQLIKEHDANGVVLTQLAVSTSGRALFAGTEKGGLRTYRLPLTGEFQEHPCTSSSITRLRISCDESMLFCGSEDGCLFIYDLRDKEARSAKREKETLTYAEEVLVTKVDLEEKRARMQELETQVNELTMQNEYQLRLKDLNMNERIKDLTEKFTHELDSAKLKYELLLQEKNEAELEADERMRRAEEKSKEASSALEAQFQGKVMAEMERYGLLQAERDSLDARWEEQNALLVESHERVIQELTEEYEARLQEEALALNRARQEGRDAQREADEARKQIEEDADREIEELKERYEGKLGAEREAGLRLKGENGIMKKKFNALQKDIEDQKEEIKALELYATITGLEKDINGLKKEIKERDETIGDKEKRIYDLKKKNQELEKFKFVLDYKIKELKRQIEPREAEIADMRARIHAMDGELERYHKSNAALDLTITDLHMKLDGVQKEAVVLRRKFADATSVITAFQHDLQEAVDHILDPTALTEAVKKLYQRHAADIAARPKADPDTDIHREYARQREYLERSIEALKRKLSKDVDLHRTENTRIVAENVALIKEINELKREIKSLKQSSTQQRSTTRSMDGAEALMSPGRAKQKSMRRTPSRKGEGDPLSPGDEDKDSNINSKYYEQVQMRPKSRERLPPMEGFNHQDALLSPTS